MNKISKYITSIWNTDKKIVLKTSYFFTILVSAILTTIITFAMSIDSLATAIGIAIYIDMALASWQPRD